MAEKEFVFKINGQQAANTIAGIQKQIKALDETIANSDINDPNFDNLIKESDRAKASLKTLQTEGVGGLKPQGMIGQLKNFGNALSDIPGPIGGVIGGINSMTASLRFIATPVGAIIAALVVVFKAFQKGIESSEKAQMGLNKIMGAFTGIIGPVIKAIGEFAAILIDGVVAAIDGVMSALESLGIDFAENAKAGMALADTLNQIEEAEGDLQVARAEQNKTLAEARELLSDTNAKYEDRKKALDSIRASEEKLAAQEVDLAKKQVAAAKENIRLYGESKEANDKLDAARIKLANTEEAFFAKKRQFNKEEKKLIAEQEAAAKEAAAAEEARRKEAAAKAKEYQQNRAESQKRTNEILTELALQEIKDEQKRAENKAIIDNQRLVEEAKKTVKNKKDLAAEISAITQKLNAELEKIEDEAQNKRRASLKKFDESRKQGLTDAQFNEKESVNKYYDDLKNTQEAYYEDYKTSLVAFETEKGFVMSIASKKSLLIEKENAERLKQIEKERADALLALDDKVAKERSDKALASLKQTQEAEFLVYKQGEEKLRDAVLKDKKATDTQKEEAEKQYAENIRAYQQKQLEDQIALLKQGVYITAEAKKEANLEILRLQDELNQNLQNKYEEDQLNFIDALNKKVADFLKNNEDLLKQINGTLQAAQAVVDSFQAFQDLKNQEDYERNKKASEDEIALLTANAEAALAIEGTTDAQKKKIKDDYNKAVAQAEYTRAKNEYDLAKAAFENGKKLQIASAIISTIQGAVQAFTSLAGIPVVGPILGGIAAAAALASGYAQVALIRATTYSGTPPKDPNAALNQGDAGGAGGSSGSKFAEGGLLMGRKHAEGGINTPYGQLEGGEFVVNREATASFLPMLEKINSMGSGSGAPNNLSVVGEQSVPQTTPIIKTYVVATEMTSQQEANKRLNDIARL